MAVQNQTLKEYSIDTGIYKNYDQRFKFDSVHVFSYIKTGESDDEIVYAGDLGGNSQPGILAYYNSGKDDISDLILDIYNGGLQLQDGNDVMLPVAYNHTQGIIYFAAPSFYKSNSAGFVVLCSKEAFEEIQYLMQDGK